MAETLGEENTFLPNNIFGKKDDQLFFYMA